MLDSLSIYQDLMLPVNTVCSNEHLENHKTGVLKFQMIIWNIGKSYNLTIFVFFAILKHIFTHRKMLQDRIE